MRDPEDWYRSAMSTIFTIHLSPMKYLVWLVPSMWPHVRMTNAVAWDRIFNGRFLDKEYAIRRYNEWIEEVKSTVPADRLLVFNTKDGWGPLCEFLDMPAPSQPFPKTNAKDEFQQRRRGIFMMALVKDFVLPVTLASVALWAARKYYLAQR